MEILDLQFENFQGFILILKLMARTIQTSRKSTGGRTISFVTPTDRAGLSALTVAQLKQILRDMGLKVGGRKSELIERIISAQQQVVGETTVEVTEYDKYTQTELLNLVQNLYGETLPFDMKRKDIIDWLQLKTVMDKTITERITGPGPQMGALSPVVTTGIEMPLIPGILPKKEQQFDVFFPQITSPLPDMSVIRGGNKKETETKGIRKKVPKEKEEEVTEEEIIPFKLPPLITTPLPPIKDIKVDKMVEEVIMMEEVISPITKPTVKLPPLFSVKLPGITEGLPEVPMPPDKLKMAISPRTVTKSTGVIISGVQDVEKFELPDITGGMGLEMVEITGMSPITTDIKLPLVSTVIPRQSIKLPPLFGSEKKMEVEKIE